MLTLFAKSIQFGIFLGLAIVSSFSAEPTAKGNSLGVRTNDGRKHFTLTADATWQLNVEKRFDASALAFRNGKLITVNDQDGTFYERLTRFPGALCDPGGYVRYETAEQFNSDHHLNIGQKVNVHRSLAAHPRYTTFPKSEGRGAGSGEARR